MYDKCASHELKVLQRDDKRAGPLLNLSSISLMYVSHPIPAWLPWWRLCDAPRQPEQHPAHGRLRADAPAGAAHLGLAHLRGAQGAEPFSASSVKLSLLWGHHLMVTKSIQYSETTFVRLRADAPAGAAHLGLAHLRGAQGAEASSFVRSDTLPSSATPHAAALKVLS